MKCSVFSCLSIAECVVTDGGDGVGDGHTRQAAAAIECVVANGGDGVGDGQFT